MTKRQGVFMQKPTILEKKRLIIYLGCCFAGFLLLLGRLCFIEIYRAPLWQEMAYEQQTRDRLITPKRGDIVDRNGIGIAQTQTVNAISVIPSQIENAEQTAQFLSETLALSYDEVFDKITQKVALVRIQTKVDTETAQIIRQANLSGVKIDEDVQRVYPYGDMAAQVIGFVGKDNQGIIGLEAKYEEMLKGEEGKILTVTDAAGRELDSTQERIPPTDGQTLVTTIDVVIQQYAEQTLAKAVEAKQAKKGSLIVLNPQNGEIYAMANYPSFDLNDPFTIQDETLQANWEQLSEQERNDARNQMWRNSAINDTYEPGSIFKIITSVAGLEEGVVTPESTFYCQGYYVAGDRQIKCWRYPRTHGSETFVEGVQNSCNPVFMEIADRLGAETFMKYMDLFGFHEKTGIDLAGEAVGIIHDLDQVGPVELATMSFGQSFQITPLQLLRAASATVNGGYMITPHIGYGIADENGELIEVFSYDKGEPILSQETSEIMKEILESVVAVGTGNKAAVEGYRIGGKTATSEKLPRRSGKYIASFITFAPANDPQVMAFVMIDEPQGVYYGGTVGGPVMQELLQNILPYLQIPKEGEVLEENMVIVPDVVGMTWEEAQNALHAVGLVADGDGSTPIVSQLPPAGESVLKDTKILLNMS